MSDIRGLQENQTRLEAECEQLRQKYMEMYNTYNGVQAWIQQAQPLHDQLIPSYNECKRHVDFITQMSATINNLLGNIKSTKTAIEQKLSSINFLEFKYQYGEVNETNIHNKIAQAYTLLEKNIKVAESLAEDRQKLIEEIDRATQESRATEQDIEPIRRQTLNDTNSTRLENKKLHEEIAKLSIKNSARELRFQSENLTKIAETNYYQTLIDIAKIDSLCKNSLHRTLTLQAHFADPSPPTESLVNSISEQINSLLPLPNQYDQIIQVAQTKATNLLDERSKLLASLRESELQYELIAKLNTEVHILDDNLRTQSDMLQFDQNTLAKHVTRLTSQNQNTSKQIEMTEEEIKKREEDLVAAVKNLETTKQDASISNQDLENKKLASKEIELQCIQAQGELETYRKSRMEQLKIIEKAIGDFYRLHPTDVIKNLAKQFLDNTGAVQEESQRADYSVLHLASLERQLAFVQKENTDFTLNSDTPIANIEFIRAITADGVTLERILPEMQKVEEESNPAESGQKKEDQKEKGMYVVGNGRGQRLVELLFHPENIEPNYPQIICILINQLGPKERVKFVETLIAFVQLSDKPIKVNYKRATHKFEFGPYPPQEFTNLTPQFIYERFAKFVYVWITFDLPSLTLSNYSGSSRPETKLVNDLKQALEVGKKYSPECEVTLNIMRFIKGESFTRQVRARQDKSIPPIDDQTFPVGVDAAAIVNCLSYYHMELYKEISASEVLALIQYRRNHDTMGKITKEMIESCGKMGAFLEEFEKLRLQIGNTIQSDNQLEAKILKWIEIMQESYNKMGNYFLCDAIDTAFTEKKINVRAKKFKEASDQVGKLMVGSFSSGIVPTAGRRLWIPVITKFNYRIGELIIPNLPTKGNLNLTHHRKVAYEVVHFLSGQDKSYEFTINPTTLEGLKKLNDYK